MFSYRGTNGQNQARRYVGFQVAAPVDVAGHGPLQPTGSLARQAVLLGRLRTRRPGRDEIITTQTVQQLDSISTITITHSRDSNQILLNDKHRHVLIVNVTPPYGAHRDVIHKTGSI